MKFKTRVCAIVIVLMTAVFLSACADSPPGNEISGVLSKAGTDLALLGTVEGISEKAWTVSGHTIKLSDETRLAADLTVGDSVRIEVSLGEDGFMNALLIEGSSTDMFVVGAEIEFYAVVEEITPTVWIIDGFEVTVTPDTEIKADIVAGDLVKVHANFAEEVGLIATEIELVEEDESELDRFEIEFLGVVEAIADEVWTIEGLDLIITPRTEIGGFIQVGDLVKVHAIFGDDEQLVAREIELAGGDDHDRDEIEFDGIVESLSDVSWTIDGREVVVTPQTEIKGTIQVGDLVKVHAFLGEGDMLIAREIELADADEENDDQDRVELEIIGTVDTISDGEWQVDGRTILITPDTDIGDEISVGDVVKVEAYEDENGTLVAHEIGLADDDVSDLDLDDDDDDEDKDDTDSDEDDHGEDHTEDRDEQDRDDD